MILYNKNFVRNELYLNTCAAPIFNYETTNFLTETAHTF